jgi:putative DNA primase/helicase
VTVDLVQQALSFISPDCGHDERAKLAGSIYSELGESGKDAWMDWAGARSAPSLQEDRDTWKSAKRFTRVKIGTLFGRAKDSGFRFPEIDQAAPQPDAALLAAERAKREAKAAATEAEYSARADQAARDARTMWADAVPATFEGAGYLLRKGVSPHGVRMLDDGTLLVPMIDIEGTLQNLQRIAPRKPEGDKPEKRILPGARKSGLFHLVGAELDEVEGLEVLLAAEGYATAASIHEATGRSVLVCMDAGNMVNVIKLARARWPLLPLLVCADDDRETEGRTGKNAGKAAALSCVRAADSDAAPCGMVLPVGLPDGGTDFNDLMVAHGHDSVAQVIGDAVAHLLDVSGEQQRQDASDEPPPWMDDVPAGDDAEAAAPAQGGGGTVVEVDFAAKGKAKAKKSPEKKSDDFWALIDGLAERYSLIYGTDQCWDHTKRVLIKIAHMRLAHGSDPIKFWLARPSRRMVDLADLVFEPGQEVPAHQINMFGGLALRPVPCDAKAVAPMLALIRHLCSGSGESADDVDAVMHWVMCWMALPLQQLGTKMQTALVFHGAQGTGKNLFFDVWRDLYGDHGITVGQTEIEDKFNGWISRKLAIVADEVVSRQEMYHKKNTLKSVVTQEKKFPIRGMQMETRWESNHANVVFLSNESMPLALEERDRRYAVVYTPLEADEALYIAVRDFLAAGGREKWLHYLQTYAIGEFNAHTKPLMTRAKERLIELNWKSSERFAHEWLNGFLPLPVRVCSAGQLYRAFRRWADQTGEKWPPAQPLFTGQVERWINERVGWDASGRREQPVLVYKVVALKDAVGNRKSVRCWLPTGAGPAEGVTEGEWAAASVDAFDADVDRFCRRPGSDVEGVE